MYECQSAAKFIQLNHHTSHGSASLGQLLPTNYTQDVTTFKDKLSVKTLITEQPYAFLNLKSLPGMAAEEAAMFFFTPCFELV